METKEDRIKIAKELILPNKKLFLPDVDISEHIIMIGLSGSWVGTKTDVDLTPRYNHEKKDKPDFRIILLDEIEPYEIDVNILGTPTRAFIRSLRSQIELVKSSKSLLSAKLLRLYNEICIFEDYEGELQDLSKEATHLLNRRPLTRPEHNDRKLVVKSNVEDALKKLNAHINGNRRDFNEIDGYFKEMIINLFTILNRWIPRKRNINNYLIELNREFGNNWINMNETNDEEDNFVLPYRERIVLLRNNYELIYNWVRSSQPL